MDAAIEHPVDYRNTLRAQSLTGREEHEDQDERDEEKADAIDLGLDDEEDPVERIEREPDCERSRGPARPSLKCAPLRFLKRREGLGHHACNRRPIVKPRVMLSIELVSMFIG